MYKHWSQAYTKFSMARLYTNVTNAFSQWGPNAADAVEASYAGKVRTVPDVEMLSQPVSKMFPRCFKYIESTIHRYTDTRYKDVREAFGSYSQ